MVSVLVLQQLPNEGYMNSRELGNFAEKITLVDTGYKTPCWLWSGALTHNGYGQFHCKGTIRRAHRVAYMHFMGEIGTDAKTGEALTLDHQCEIEACANPYHCKPETDAENNRLKWVRLYERSNYKERR